MKVLVLGSTILDVMYNVNAIPNAGEDVVLKNETMNIGGCALNVSSALSFNKINHHLRLFIGSGERAEKVKKLVSLASNEYVTYKYVINENADNGYCLTLIDDNRERTFLTIDGGENVFPSESTNDFCNDCYDVVYINGYMLDNEQNSAVTLGILKQLKPRYIFCAIGPRYTSINQNIIDQLNKLNVIYHLNESELLGLTNESNATDGLKKLSSFTNNIVVVTLGPSGCMYIDNGGVIHYQEALNVNVVNTNGAGDTHCGSVMSTFITEGINLELANKQAATVVSSSQSAINQN